MSNNIEIIRVAESVASEKGISVDSVIEAIEQGIQVAAKKKYGHEYDIHVQAERRTGEFKIFKRLEVVELVDDVYTQISLQQIENSTGNAHKNVKIGDYVTQPLPAIDIKRLAAQVVKQTIVQKVKIAEKIKQYDLYKDKVGNIINGIVKKISSRGVLLDIGGVEAFLLREDTIPSEHLNQNDRIRACIKEVVRNDIGVQIYLSRASNKFMEQLFIQEVPEIYDGIINIKAVAREPGSRAKIAVQAVESNLDPVGACVGVRGSRVQAVINELRGEKIDVIEWSSNPATLVVNALTPARVLKVVMDEESERMETVVSQNEYSIAIGRRGQNARLASKITGWSINILTEEEEQNIRKEESKKIYDIFVDNLGLDDISARLLIAEGIDNIEDIVDADYQDIMEIDGFDEELAKKLVNNLKKFIKTREYSKLKWETLKLNKDLMDISHMNVDIAQYLANNNINKLDQLADLSRDEFKDIVPEEVISEDDRINELIMSAREIVFN